MSTPPTHLVFLTPEIRAQIIDPKRAPGRILYVEAPEATLCNVVEDGDLMVTHLDIEHVTCLRCTTEAQKRWFR